MAAAIAFIKPTLDKLCFLVEWAVLILFLTIRGDLHTLQVGLVAAYPLLFFYLVGCLLVACSHRVSHITPVKLLASIAVGLVLLDQAAKAAVEWLLPYRAKISLVNGWLAIVHERNYAGAWLFEILDLPSSIGVKLTQWGLILVMIVLLPLCHRFYTTTNRTSLWADIVFLGLFAACWSWLIDKAVRGYILDFIALPGLFAADFKDIFTSLAVGAILVEVRQNPSLSWRWQGWHTELAEGRRVILNLYHFGKQEARQVWARLRRSS